MGSFFPQVKQGVGVRKTSSSVNVAKRAEVSSGSSQAERTKLLHPGAAADVEDQRGSAGDLRYRSMEDVDENRPLVSRRTSTSTAGSDLTWSEPEVVFK